MEILIDLSGYRIEGEFLQELTEFLESSTLESPSVFYYETINGVLTVLEDTEEES